MADVKVSVPVTIGHCIHAKVAGDGALEGEKFDFTLYGRFGIQRFGSKVRKAEGSDVIVLSVEYSVRHYWVSLDDLERIAKAKKVSGSGIEHSLFDLM